MTEKNTIISTNYKLGTRSGFLVLLFGGVWKNIFTTYLQLLGKLKNGKCKH